MNDADADSPERCLELENLLAKFYRRLPPRPPSRVRQKPNERCSCGSGLKAKKCCESVHRAAEKGRYDGMIAELYSLSE